MNASSCKQVIIVDGTCSSEPTPRTEWKESGRPCPPTHTPSTRAVHLHLQHRRIQPAFTYHQVELLHSTPCDKLPRQPQQRSSQRGSTHPAAGGGGGPEPLLR